MKFLDFFIHFTYQVVYIIITRFITRVYVGFITRWRRWFRLGFFLFYLFSFAHETKDALSSLLSLGTLIGFGLIEFLLGTPNYVHAA